MEIKRKIFLDMDDIKDRLDRLPVDVQETINTLLEQEPFIHLEVFEVTVVEDLVGISHIIFEVSHEF